MSAIRALFAISSVALAGAAGCAQPGIVEVNEMTPPMSTHDGSIVAGDTSVGPAPVQDASVGPAPVQDASVGPAPVQDSSVTPVQDSSITPVQDSSITPAQDTGVAEAGPAPLPPCPTGYTCQDPGAMIKSFGASGGVTRADGSNVTLSCGKSGVENCDRNNPQKSCPTFVNAYCAHLVIEFPPLDTWTCAQDCTK